MLVHKFGKKPRFQNEQPLTIEWKPATDVNYKPEKKTPRTWEIFCQERIVIKPNETKNISLGFGVELSEGTVLVSLKHELKLQRCSIKNDTVLESVKDIVISIQSNSKQAVVILPGQELCFIHYTI